MSDYKQAIFNYMSEQHGVLLLETEREELISIVDSELSKTIGDLQEDNGKLRSALRSIIRHQKVIGGSIYQRSAIKKIAEAALNE